MEVGSAIQGLKKGRSPCGVWQWMGLEVQVALFLEKGMVQNAEAGKHGDGQETLSVSIFLWSIFCPLNPNHTLCSRNNSWAVSLRSVPEFVLNLSLEPVKHLIVCYFALFSSCLLCFLNFLTLHIVNSLQAGINFVMWYLSRCLLYYLDTRFRFS